VAVAQVQAAAGRDQVVFGSDRPWANGAPQSLPAGVADRNPGALFAGVAGWITPPAPPAGERRHP
jgi:hypothetical protein